MGNFAEVLNANGSAWLFIPTAILLGALHGLEPGHSKTMMAAFIVAVRGTVAQAALLGLSATLSHTAIVWIIALGGMYFGAQLNLEAHEAYLQIASGILILVIAGWMSWRVWKDQAEARRLAGQASGRATRPHHHHGHHGHDDHHHGHHHHGHDHHGHDHHHHHDHGHHHDHSHDHAHAPARTLAAAQNAAEEAFESELQAVEPSVYADAHERAHALDIERRFANRDVTTGQIVVFGLTGGLIPCPASITVLLLCLQVGRIGLGAALVLCFSIGLALTLVFVGVAAALGMRHAAARWPVIETLAARAPYFSGALVSLVGLYMLWLGVAALRA